MIVRTGHDVSSQTMSILSGLQLINFTLITSSGYLAGCQIRFFIHNTMRHHRPVRVRFRLIVTCHNPLLWVG